MDDKLPDFSRWSTNRLLVLLRDYKEAVGTSNWSGQIHKRKNRHPETELYKKWIAVLQAELDRRKVKI